jgi:hypothetical protein
MIQGQIGSFAANSPAAVFFSLTVADQSAMADSPIKSMNGVLTGTAIVRQDSLLVFAFCALAVLLVLWPIGLFLFKQWGYRKERILAVLEGDAVVLYYKQFKPGAAILKAHPIPKHPEDPAKENGPFEPALRDQYLAAFAKDFNTWYGRRYYIFPILAMAILTCACAYWAQTMLRVWSANGIGPAQTLRGLVASAMAGAFVWIISDEIDRLRRRDFTTSDVYTYVFRILLAIPFAWAIAAISVDGKPLGLPGSIPLAFFLGAFPTQTLFKIARRVGSQQLKLGDSMEDERSAQLEKLQSVGKSSGERFNDEGITTITGLAYSDPIDLTIRTNFDFNYVVDCVSQALEWIYFKDDCDKLFEFSLRGAQEIIFLTRWADGIEGVNDPVAQARAVQTIKDAAAKLGLSADAFRSTLDQIADDPYTRFLFNVWH